MPVMKIFVNLHHCPENDFAVYFMYKIVAVFFPYISYIVNIVLNSNIIWHFRVADRLQAKKKIEN